MNPPPIRTFKTTRNQGLSYFTHDNAVLLVAGRDLSKKTYFKITSARRLLLLSWLDPHVTARTSLNQWPCWPQTTF